MCGDLRRFIEAQLNCENLRTWVFACDVEANLVTQFEWLLSEIHAKHSLIQLINQKVTEVRTQDAKSNFTSL